MNMRHDPSFRLTLFRFTFSPLWEVKPHTTLLKMFTVHFKIVNCFKKQVAIKSNNFAKSDHRQNDLYNDLIRQTTEIK